MQPVTVSRILLCSTHIVPDTTTPPSDDWDVSLTTSALLENLKAGEDPLNVLDVGPAIHDPVVLSLTFPPPVATSPKVVGPIRRRQKTTAYRGRRTICTRMYWQRSTTAVTLFTCGVVRSTFFKWRWIVEMNMVDSRYYSSLSQQLKTD